MKNISTKYYLNVMLTIAIGFNCACNKESACLQYANITAKIDFKHENDTLLITDTALIQAILITDSFYITQKGAKSMQLLMNSTAEAMRFVIASDSTNAVYDTVSLQYARLPHFVSKECGYNYFYTLLSAVSTKFRIKKIKIIQPIINDNINAKHLQIYY
jgi:Family of unknown function (DUF6452)